MVWLEIAELITSAPEPFVESALFVTLKVVVVAEAPTVVVRVRVEVADVPLFIVAVVGLNTPITPDGSPEVPRVTVKPPAPLPVTVTR
jgi:hypothetical protein